MKSLARELALTLTAGFVLTGLIAGWWLLRSVQREMLGDFDRASRVKALALAELMEHDGEYVEFEIPDDRMLEYRPGGEAQYFTIRFWEGPRIATSDSLEGEELVSPDASADQPDSWDLKLPDGRAGRAHRRVVVVEEDDSEDNAEDGGADASTQEVRAEIVVARSREHLNRTTRAAWTGLWWGGGASVVAVVALAWFSVWRVRRRIGRLTDQLSEVDGRSLDTRVERNGLVRELMPLAETLNALLERLEEGFDRERRMSSNIAHEMRTPVSELRSAVEIAQRWPDDNELRDRAMHVAGCVSVRMSTTIHGLLRLARLQSSQARLERSAVDLAQMLRERCETQAEAAAAVGLRIEGAGPSSLAIQADPPLLEILLGNLFENALAHAPAGGLIRCAWSRQDGRWTWRLTNPSVGLRPDDLSRLTEALWQRDDARSNTMHAGLGLSIAASICEAMGWDLSFHLEEGDFSVRVEGALAPEDPKALKSPDRAQSALSSPRSSP